MNHRKNKKTALQVPSNLNIVAIGGCGKGLISEICEHEWFLKYYFKDGYHLKIYALDTDENEKEQDEERIKDIDQRIKEIGGGSNVETSVLYLPNLATISHVSDLASKEIADRIKDRNMEPKVDVWWLNDAEYGISFDDLKKIDPFLIDDFGGGVHRRRAISKAIFYKVISEGESSGFPTFSRGSIAIIVGLGGGTGSGMVIDLARYIRSLRGPEAEIWLYAILPTTEEGEKEQLNAAIALTELEYLNLKEKLFNCIILTSLGPTGFKRGEEARREVQEFDSIFPYIFVNSLHTVRRDLGIFDARKSFSSFIFADAHVIEYPIEELRKLKSEFEKVINEIKEITNNRKELNRTIRDFLDKANHRKEGIPTKENIDFVKKEIGNMEKIWQNEIGELLQYQTIEGILYYISNNIPLDIFPDKTKKYDDLIDYVSKLKAFSQSVKEEELRDESDRKLYRIIPEALETIEDTAKILKRISGIEDEIQRVVLNEVLRGKENIISSIGNLQVRINIFRDDIRNLEDEIDKCNTKSKKIDNQKSGTEKTVNNKLDDIGTDINSFTSLDIKIREVEGRQENLKMHIEEIINQCKTGEIKGEDEVSYLQSAGVAKLESEIDLISREIGEDLDGLKSLISAIALYYYYNYKLEGLESRKIAQKAIDAIIGNVEARRRKYEAMIRDKENLIKGNAKYWNIAIHSPFELTVADDFLIEGLNKKMEDIRNRIINSIKSDFEIEDEELHELEDTLKQNDKGKIRGKLREQLINISLLRGGYYTKKEESESFINSKNEIKKKKEMDLRAMDMINELAEETFNYRRNLSRHYESYYNNFVIKNESFTASSKTIKGMYSTRFGEINPKVLSLISDESEMGDLDRDENGKKELDKLINEIKSSYTQLIDNYKLGIHNLTIPFDTTERWTFGKAGLVISSTSSYISTELASSKNSKAITEDIEKTLALRNNNDARLITHNYAKPWDISLIFFAAASFLDNISPFTAGGGYREIYERDKDNLLHHVLLLQHGKYIVRKKLLELNKAGEIAKREMGGEKVNSEILDLYEEKDIRGSLTE
jgi:hypothetical protein